MHDLHLADRILQFVREEAEKRKLTKVHKVVVELGQIVEHEVTIKPENLKFNIQGLASGTVFQGGELEVIPISEMGIYRIKEIVGE
ncbi:hydrogenase maturation nickel metallochaperone HypA [Patescibacteria group bacterium]|nr:hydrogenase maturation nickel metallochaperone HypA [Patescibacteria group bacterium]